MASSHKLPFSKVPGSVAIHTRALVAWIYTPPGEISIFIHLHIYIFHALIQIHTPPLKIFPLAGCSPLYHIFCTILHIIYFSNNYLLYIVSYNLIYILGRIPPHLDLYLVFQGHSFSLYYTVFCTGILFHLVQLFQILILIHLVTGRL